MAKPFALPDAPGPGGGGASSSGAGPPAGNGASSNPNQGAPHPGYQPPNQQQQQQQQQQPPQSAPPVVAQGNAGAFPMAGPGHAPSTPIPVAGGNNHYYHPYPQPMYHLPPGQNTHFYYPGYPGSPYAHSVGGPSNGGNPAELPHPLPHVMTPPNSAFAHPPYLGAANDDLVQALYEALHRCGVRGTICLACSQFGWTNDRFRESPPTPLSQSPPSASCSPSATGGFCAPPQTAFFPRTPASAPALGFTNGSRLFFHPSALAQQCPRPAPTQPTPLSANSHSSSSGISSSLDTPSCSSGTPHYVQSQAQPVLFQWQDDGDSSESEGSTSQATSSSGCSPYCYGLDESESSPAGSLTPSTSSAASPTSSGVTVYATGVPPHLDTAMARREQLQEFPGKIPPQRKRRSRTPKPKKTSRFLEKPLMWQMAVTAALIALGCGYFAGR